MRQPRKPPLRKPPPPNRARPQPPEFAGKEVPRMRYDFVVWDFDGTLADTLSLAVAVYNDLAARHGFLPVDDPVAVRDLGTREFLRRHRISLLRLPLLIR